MKERNTIYKIIFTSCIAISLLTYFTRAVSAAESMLLSVIVIAFLLIINAGYGGGFSTLPALLSERFGMKRISQIHGLSLSAWAVAGLTGNNTSEIILKASDNNYQNIVIIGAGLYIVALVICIVLVSKKKDVTEE